ncbi:MAG: hypothetical protein WBE75_00525 [Candidatus Omnitrophota bacterium]|jgi:hypothetical protein
MEDNIQEKLEQSIKNLLVTAEDLRKLTEQMDVSGTELMRSRLSEAQWYLGEEKSRRQKIEQDLLDKENHISRMTEDIHNLKQQLNETQWYLGEERARLQQLENQLKSA